VLEIVVEEVLVDFVSKDEEVMFLREVGDYL
jgi:hypothetical protein